MRRKQLLLDMDTFAEEFKEVIDWMLTDAYGNEIKGDLRLFKINKEKLFSNPDSPEALKFIVELIVTQAWFYRKPLEFDGKLDSFIEEYGTNFRTPLAQAKLISLSKQLARPRIKARAEENTRRFLKNYTTIKQFTDKLYELAKQGKTEVLGEKGRDNYLRDFGYWDRIPMDRHEMRFIIRTGIYHACSAKNRADPLQKASLHGALTRFCSKYLKGKIVEDIELGNAPGIVDIFIWSYCAKERYNICGSSPKCHTCKLNGVCLYPLSKIS